MILFVFLHHPFGGVFLPPTVISWKYGILGRWDVRTLPVVKGAVCTMSFTLAPWKGVNTFCTHGEVPILCGMRQIAHLKQRVCVQWGCIGPCATSLVYACEKRECLRGDTCLWSVLWSAPKATSAFVAWGVVFQRRHTSVEVKRMVCAQWHQVSLVQPLSAFMRTALAFGAFGIYLKDDIRLEEKHFSLVRSVPPCGRTLRTRSFWVERCTAKAVGVQILLDSGICLRGWTSSLRRLDVIVLEETSFSETSGRFWAARKAPSFWP
jgi:hypothetical protein